MCGIAGIFGKDAREDVVVRMRDSLAHRGPDGAGVFMESGVALGHRRLSIIDLSDNGRQPMTTQDGRFTVVFNGEIYNYKEIRAEIESKYRWASQSDTEVLLHAYEEWGPAMVDRLNGMFAFAIYDAAAKTLFCVRDRLGIKPFYYHWDGKRFLFGSEIKAILAAGVRAVPNHGRIYDFLAAGLYDHTDDTFFFGICKLPAGHLLMLQHGAVPTPVRYWDVTALAAVIAVPNDDREVIAQFSDLLRDAVRLRLRSDVPVGVTLSSGIDSTSLLAHLRAAQPETSKLHAFSICFNDKRFDEGPRIEEVLRLFGNPWHRSVLEAAEVPALAERVLHFQDEPYGGIPQVAFFKLFASTKEAGVTVLLEGHGVEEYLTGYPLYFPPYWTDLLLRGNLPALVREISGFARAGRGSVRKAMSNWFSYLTGNGLHLDFTRSAQVGVVPASYAAYARQPLAHERPFPTRLENTLYRNMTRTKLPRVLRFQDRMSMASGRELRLPFLDYRLVEYVYALAGSFKIRDGEDKWLLRKSVEGLIPRERVWAKKSYVVTPQTAWLRGELRSWVEKTLRSESFRSRACFDPRGVERAVGRFYADPAPRNSFFVWQLVNLESWFRHYIDV